MEHPKENKCPFYFSEDGPPTLHKAIRKICEETRGAHTDIAHGARI